MRIVWFGALMFVIGAGVAAMAQQVRPVQPDINGQQVIGIQGAPVSAAYPRGGQVLAYSTPLGLYVPGGTINGAAWPTSCSGQAPGTIWNDSSVLHVC